MKYKDWNIIPRINERFHELKEEMQGINSLIEFQTSGSIRKAIIFDLLQIGELLNHISKDLNLSLGEDIVSSIVGLRNRIVHGYGAIDDRIVFLSIRDDLPQFMQTLNNDGMTLYYQNLRKMLGKQVIVQVDRPVGTVHEKMIYPINYGYINDIVAPDGEMQDAYVIGTKSPLHIANGTIIAIVHRENDIEDKLIISCDNLSHSKEEIIESINFQEQFFKIHIIM